MLAPSLGHAQNGNVPVMYKVDDEGRKWPIEQPKGFPLFANEDLGYGAPKMAGTYGFGITNFSAGCPFYLSSAGHRFVCGVLNGTQAYFEIPALHGVPISDFRKIQRVWPGVATMLGGFGYSTPYPSWLALGRRMGSSAARSPVC
jgi:hypothetical protein